VHLNSKEWFVALSTIKVASIYTFVCIYKNLSRQSRWQGRPHARDDYPASPQSWSWAR